MAKKDRWSERKQDKVEKQAAKDVERAGVRETQAFCTECHEWYNAADDRQANKHAH